MESQAKPAASGWISASIDYFRVDRGNWPRVAEQAKALGFERVDCHVPWSLHHNLDSGEYVFDDSADKRGERFGRNLIGFLDACAEQQLKVILRPLPSIHVELPQAGIPKAIVDRADGARTAAGDPLLVATPPVHFAAPSYHDASFREALSAWLAAVASAFADDPRIAGVLLDRPPHHSLWDNPFAHDYAPIAIEAFRSFVEARHGDQCPYDQATMPPRRWSTDNPIELYADWLAWNRASEAQWVAQWREDLASLGPCWGPWPSASAYLDRDEAVTEDCVLRSGATSGIASVPFSDRLWWPTGANRWNAVAGYLAHGVQKLTLSTLVERDGAFNTALTSDGNRGPAAESLKTLLTLDAELGLTEPTDADFALVRGPRTQAYLACAQLLAPLPTNLCRLIGAGRHALLDDAHDATRTLLLRAERGCAALAAEGSWSDCIEVDDAIPDSSSGRTLIVLEADLHDEAFASAIAAHRGAVIICTNDSEPAKPVDGATTAATEDALLDALHAQRKHPKVVQVTQPCQVRVGSINQRGEHCERALFVINPTAASHKATLRDATEQPLNSLWRADTGIPLTAAEITLAPQQVMVLRWRQQEDGRENAEVRDA